MSPRSQDIKQPGLAGFLVQPDAPTTGGVVILPTIFGVNAFVRGYAETLARTGLAAAVWDLYEGQRRRIMKNQGARASFGRGRRRSKKWIDYMPTTFVYVGRRARLLSRGRYSLMTAARDTASRPGAAPSIGSPNQNRMLSRWPPTSGAPHMSSWPRHVASVETYAALKEALHKRAAPTIWQYYPDAEHGFMHRKEPAANPAATVIASPQLVAFLKACLL